MHIKNLSTTHFIDFSLRLRQTEYKAQISASSNSFATISMSSVGKAESMMAMVTPQEMLEF